MAWATKKQKVLAFAIRGRVGKPTFYGWAQYGWSEYGSDYEDLGVYQMRRSVKGIPYDVDPISGKYKLRSKSHIQHEICFMRPCWPPQPPSVLRDAQQDKFKIALLMWQSLTLSEKRVYNTIAVKRSKRGYDYFMSNTLKSL